MVVLCWLLNILKKEVPCASHGMNLCHSQRCSSGSVGVDQSRNIVILRVEVNNNKIHSASICSLRQCNLLVCLLGCGLCCKKRNSKS